MKGKTLSVAAIKQGTVIDHIVPGQALKIIHLLKLNEEETPVTIGLHLKSKSKGLKDLIKIEDVFLTEEHCACIAIFSPAATVNVIENYKVVKKIPVLLPPAVEGLLRCPNASCITRHEKAPTRFLIEDNYSLVVLHCHHCEKLFSADEMYTQTI